ncbi:ABC transporter permease [Butyrivibrio sp. MC2013]|uniref:ABC transporter permease n=1 Tax=Butyrivibrio sp. MC2013 TaxID=1280686 RepID=UPI0003FDDE85|nr:ABC transporter permease [Butyrivibrio sp. MC2013]
MKQKKSILANETFQSIAASVLCIVIGMLIGYIVLLVINAKGANEAITTLIKNYFTFSSKKLILKNLGNTLIKTAPLIMCALSVQFCYKAGLFNIGAAGQYVVGAGASLYAALGWHMPWFVCVLFAMCAGGIYGAIVGFLKAFRNVNEVISGIMLNWIGLYLVNMLLSGVKETTSPYTLDLAKENTSALMPTLGMEKFFSNNTHVTIAIPLAVIIAIVIWVIQKKTVFGYELRATGINKQGARYAGMKENTNIILTLVIGGALAGTGAAFQFLTGYEQWTTTMSSVPAMGFNGIAATFLGGLHPVGTVFASYFIQHITSGGARLDKNIYPSQISDLISGIIIYLCGFVLFFKYAINLRLQARAEKELRLQRQREENASSADAKEEKGGDK